MRRFSALELIELGERGGALGSAGRAILLLAASGEMTREQAEAMPLGARDRWLFGLRAAQFGPMLELQHGCPHCGETAEFTVSAAQVGRDRLPGLPDLPHRTVESDGRGVPVRAVTAGDLAAAEQAGDAELAAAVLRSRVAPGGEAIAGDTLDRVLSELDPEAELQIEIACPGCTERRTVLLDVAEFFWREIELRIPRLLQQVADLARAFHWSESDILALPSWRRQFYLSAARA